MQGVSSLKKYNKYQSDNKLFSFASKRHDEAFKIFTARIVIHFKTCSNSASIIWNVIRTFYSVAIHIFLSVDNTISNTSIESTLQYDNSLKTVCGKMGCWFSKSLGIPPTPCLRSRLNWLHTTLHKMK